jgi:hypothetical protein
VCGLVHKANRNKVDQIYAAECGIGGEKKMQQATVAKVAEWVNAGEIAVQFDGATVITLTFDDPEDAVDWWEEFQDEIADRTAANRLSQRGVRRDTRAGRTAPPTVGKVQQATAVKVAVVRENRDKLELAARRINILRNANGQPVDARAADEIEALEAATRRFMAATVNASSGGA